MTLADVDEILRQASDLGTIEWIYFEGGEPFLYHAVLTESVRRAAAAGFRVGIVSNAYWATGRTDAMEWLRPLGDHVQDLSISSDGFHGSELLDVRLEHAREAADALGIPLGVITVASSHVAEACEVRGQLPDGESAVMFRGRAAETLAPLAPPHPTRELVTCPHEDLREPGRVHVDPLGHVHICQGISIGNLFRTPLSTIVATYVPEHHPVTGPLLDGGPLELACRYQVPHRDGYADECHLCFETRRALRSRFPETLAPAQMYGEPA